MALKETTKSNNKLVPYVIRYNPSLPNIGDIIKNTGTYLRFLKTLV